MTLVEAAKLAPSIQAGSIIEEYARTSDILRVLPFENHDGTGIHYNREDELPGVGFRGINEGYTESVGVINPQSEAFRIAGGDLDVDKFFIDTQGEEIRTTHEMMKVAALSLMWTRNFIKGDSRTNPRIFDGLQVRLTGSQLVKNADAGGPLSLAKLDEAIDQVDGANHLIMSKTHRRKLTAAARAGIGGDIRYEQNEFGKQITMYNDLPILIADYDNLNNQILDFTETSPDGTSSVVCSSIYVVCFADRKLVGIQGKASGKYGIDTRDLGELETKPVLRTRVEWYNAIACYHGRAAARIAGITNAPIIN
ncbi:major capsid protein [Nostoc sp.]|uniref:major capsid protein n=1 Tax=Nostoc sp. TaxID=1180 RepID=UPI002FF08034